MQNPYWIAYRNLRLNNKKRYMASAGLSYQILDWLNVAGRVRIDNTHSEYEGKLYASSSNTRTDGSTQGHYTVNNGQYSQTYADVLVNINKRIQDFTIVANIGASYSGVTSKELGYAGPIRETGIPNLFNVYDLDNAKKRATQVGWREATESVFASAEVGWKSMLYLTVPGRNDWACPIGWIILKYADRLVLSVILIRVFLLILLTRMMPISKTGNRRRIIPLVNYIPNVPTRGR